MSLDREMLREFLSRDLLDFCIRLGFIVLAVVACEKIFAPFIPIMLWGLILAIALYPLFAMLRSRTGFSEGRTATVLVLLGILLIGVPSVMLGSSFAAHIFEVIGDFDAQSFTLPAPREGLREWPLLGERLYGVWADAYADFPAFVEKLQPQLGSFGKTALGAAASTAGTLLFFFGALIIAGIMMAYAAPGASVMERVFVRIAGPKKGPGLHRLSTLTVRSVAVGVVGVAVIQALLLGIGFLLAGIPAAGLLALIVLIIGILQLPALLVSLPSIAYLWMAGDGGVTMNVVLTIYFIVAGFADNVLKPMLLGRGVDVPMPIVLIGAIGGMVGAGIVGLFVGAVVLSVGYELFMGWLDDAASDPEPAGDV
ncbi:MAG: AI-2E family transporter [Congregibacter sp.]